MKKDIIFSWSGGKDSAIALYKISRLNEYNIRSLVTNVNQAYDRISMHGVRRSLLHSQFQELNIDFYEVMNSKVTSNAEYEKTTAEMFNHFKAINIDHICYGDIFLEDLKVYREKLASSNDFKCIFPLWKQDTAKLSKEFIELGFRTIVVCVDAAKLDISFAGREYDLDFLRDLPEDIDPCGENGEFHTFTYSGPIFKNNIDFIKGDVVKKGEFYYCDLLDPK